MQAKERGERWNVDLSRSRLYFTTFPAPAPSTGNLNNPKNPLHPKIRSKTRYFSQGSISDDAATYYWFTIDDDLPYMSFFEDWGPLNLGQVYKACILIHELLEVSRFPLVFVAFWPAL
jgi:cell division cycle 14